MPTWTTFDGTEWTDAWDSSATSTLPTAIRFQVVLAGANPNQANSAPIELVVPVLVSTSTSQAQAAGRRHRIMTRHPTTLTTALPRQRGSVLIIVLWICLGLVALTLYFANSMSSELRSGRQPRGGDCRAPGRRRRRTLRRLRADQLRGQWRRARPELRRPGFFLPGRKPAGG